MGNELKIAVVGATGQQGGSVVDALLAAGHSVRGITRNLSGSGASALKERGVEVVQGEATNGEQMQAALTGVDGAFLVTTPFEAGIEAETQQGVSFADAAKAVNLPHLVFSSVSDADRSTGIPHFDSKYVVEEHIRSLGIPSTIIAPAFFYENMMAPFVLPGLQNGSLAQAIPAGTKLQAISVRTIGRFAAHVLSQRDVFIGKRINLAGDSLTGTEYAQAIGAASGRDIGYVELPIDQVRQMSEDMALMYEWFSRVGYSADIEGLRRDYPEIGWERFSDWAARQDWTVLEDRPEAAS